MLMNKKSEEFFIKYLKTLPNSHIKQFYNDVEWTPYPVLVIKEFQRRFKPKDAEFLDKLVESVDDAKKKGQKIGKLAKIRGIKLSQRVKLRAKKTVSKKITKAKRMIRSSNDNVELIKKLGELKTSSVALHGGKSAASYNDVATSANEKVLAFKREKNGETLYYIANMTAEPVEFSAEIEGDFIDYMNDSEMKLTKDQQMSFKGWEYRILINK